VSFGKNFENVKLLDISKFGDKQLVAMFRKVDQMIS